MVESGDAVLEDQSTILMGDGFQFRFQDVSAPLHNNRIAHVYKNSRS